jgi:hypothetical protein
VPHVVVGGRGLELHFNTDSFCVPSVHDEVNFVPPIIVAEV